MVLKERFTLYMRTPPHIVQMCCVYKQTNLWSEHLEYRALLIWAVKFQKNKQQQQQNIILTVIYCQFKSNVITVIHCIYSSM